jgi:hypothetical protein
VARDLSLLHGLARLLERTIPESRVYSPVGLVREFDRAITAELDFGIEADNATRFTDNFVGETGIRFPRIYPEVSGKHVLTQEFFNGLKVTDAVRHGASGPTIARDAVRIILKMVFEDGRAGGRQALPGPHRLAALPPGAHGGGAGQGRREAGRSGARTAGSAQRDPAPAEVHAAEEGHIPHHARKPSIAFCSHQVTGVVIVTVVRSGQPGDHCSCHSGDRHPGSSTTAVRGSNAPA